MERLTPLEHVSVLRPLFPAHSVAIRGVEGWELPAIAEGNPPHIFPSLLTNYSGPSSLPRLDLSLVQWCCPCTLDDGL